MNIIYADGDFCLIAECSVVSLSEKDIVVVMPSKYWPWIKYQNQEYAGTKPGIFESGGA